MIKLAFFSIPAALFSGLAVLLTTQSGINVDTNCSDWRIICTEDYHVYHWFAAVAVGVCVLLLLLAWGIPILVAGRIGRARNRRGYVAGIFFGWVGLVYIVLMPPRESDPDVLGRALADYRRAS